MQVLPLACKINHEATLACVQKNPTTDTGDQTLLSFKSPISPASAVKPWQTQSSNQSANTPP